MSKDKDKKVDKRPKHLQGVTRQIATDAQIIKSLMDHDGHIANAARALGYIPQSLRSIICNNPLLRAAKNEIRERKLDNAESKLDEHIYEKDNLQALLEYLKATGRHRGYGSSIDINMEATHNLKTDDSVFASLMAKFTDKLQKDSEDGK